MEVMRGWGDVGNGVILGGGNEMGNAGMGAEKVERLRRLRG